MKWALPLIAAMTACSAAPKTQVDEVTLVRQAKTISAAADDAVAKDVTEIDSETGSSARETTNEIEDSETW